MVTVAAEAPLPCSATLCSRLVFTSAAVTAGASVAASSEMVATRVVAGP